MAEKKDAFANYAIITVTESAANTLTFKKLETGISLTEKVAWIIARIEYFVNKTSAGTFNSDSDVLQYGLSLSNAFAAPGIVENTIIDFNQLIRLDHGTAASALMMHQPFIKDFSSMPSGGIIVPPTPLYLFAKGTGLADANAVTARIHYTMLRLQVDQYWELVEARRVLES